MNYNYNSRSDVPKEYCWDLTSRFKNDEAWYQEFNDLKEHISGLEKYKGKIFQEDNLYQLLDEYYTYYNRLVKLFHYASCKQDEDLNIPEYNQMFQMINNLFGAFEESISFMTPEILHSEHFKIDSLIEKNPKLKRFKHILEKLDLEKQYTKDEETEKIISILTKDLNNYETMAATLLNSNLDYGKIKDEDCNSVTLTSTNYAHFVTSKNRNLRKKAFNQMNKVRASYINIFGQNLIDFMAKHASIAKIRGYKSTKEMDFLNDGVPIQVHETLKKQVLRGIDLFQEYYKTRKKILGVSKLEPYDLNAPIIKSKKKYTIPEAEEYVYNATKVLGKDYSKRLKQGFKDHWIDYATYKGKRSGGYCCTTYPNSYNIFMSFHEDYNSISTIAHETGHAVNSTYIFENNTVEYTNYDLYTCEVASLLNEILLADYVINNDFPKEEKISVINEMLRTINGNFYTAIMENSLEDIVYEKLDKGENVSYEDLSNIMNKLITDFYGNTLSKGEYYKNMWIVRIHYFTPWYLYKYSTCLCGAVYFASKILKGDKEALNTYKEFLKVGTNKFSNDKLLELNIDLTKDSLYDELFEYYKSLLDKLKELTKEGVTNE